MEDFVRRGPRTDHQWYSTSMSSSRSPNPDKTDGKNGEGLGGGLGTGALHFIRNRGSVRRQLKRETSHRVVGHEIPERAFSDFVEKNGFNLYPACKHATVAMTHSLRREIMATKLPYRITSISPGLVKTNIAKVAGFPELFNEILSLKPEDIADGLIYALGTRPEVQVTEITIRRTGEP